MFDRRKYKNFAKQQLKGRWGPVVLMTLIISMILSLFQIPDLIKLFNSTEFWNLIYGTSTDFLTSYTIATNESTSLISSLLQTIADAIFTVAALNLYLKMSRSPEKVTLKTFIEGLNDWLRAALAGLWQLLWVFLWSLLFIIPGIVKAYAYSQIYYLVVEYKNLSVTKAMRISMIITKGHKWDLFVTQMSFLGWAILCCFTAGIGLLWLEPYMNMTLTNAYHAMLKEALESGKIKPEDLTE